MYHIYGKEPGGRHRFLFSWTRSMESGIARAKAEAAENGREFIAYWATEVEPKEYVA